MQRTIVVFFVALAVACVIADGRKPRSQPDKDSVERKLNPDRFGGTMVTQFDQLPSEGHAATRAWASSYWPSLADSINRRWRGRNELSPAEKYDRAFNDWRPDDNFMSLQPFDPDRCEDNFDREYYHQLGPAAKYASTTLGNAEARDGVDSDGDGDIDECDDNDGVETWWGLCHAWVPAAMLEPAPQRSVTYNGVTFHTGDMQALLVAAYNRSGADMIGGRCNVGNEESNPVERDEHGRAVDVECRDTDPGALHIILTNFLGIQHRPFAENRTDRDTGAVWTRPVVGFAIERLEEITRDEAESKAPGHEYHPDADELYDVKVTVTYIEESHASITPANPSSYERNDYYSYVLEVDANGDVIGGAWYGDTRRGRPDFLWAPRPIERSEIEVLDLEAIRNLVRMSEEPPIPWKAVTGSARLRDTPIRDNDPEGINSQLQITDVATIGSVQLELDIAHPYVGDLEVTLSHNGVSRLVHDRAGGASDNLFGTFLVSGFSGHAAQGDWTLHVADHAAQDEGSLRSWGVTIVPWEPGETGNGVVVEATGTGAIAIPDNDPTGVSSTAAVGDTLTIGHTQVDLHVTHTYVSDLEIALSHGGQSSIVHNRAGGDSNDIDATIDASGFVGADGNGQWTLTVRDLSGQDVGTLDSWTVRLFDETTGAAATTPPPGQTFAGAGGIFIPDNNPTGIQSLADVPSSVTGGSVGVAVNITHTWSGDLRIWVEHGSYSRVLREANGSDGDNVVEAFVLDDFVGSPAGTWTLRVSDNAAQDTGVLESWSVTVAP